MMPLTRSALLRMIVGEAPILFRQLRRFREQLPGVAHGADGIPDLVRDAGTQAAEGREL